MKVITLDRQLFADHCSRLERMSADFHPDLIVTIASGGDYVGNLMFRALPHISVTRRRPSTKAKRPLLMKLVRRLPLPIRNLLRMIESRLLSKAAPRRSLPVELSEEAVQALSEASRILVVDDAVDSGATLGAVLSAIAALPGSREIASAAITVTTPSPLVAPTYYIYNNRTLIRFPWSTDN